MTTACTLAHSRCQLASRSVVSVWLRTFFDESWSEFNINLVLPRWIRRSNTDHTIVRRFNCVMSCLRNVSRRKLDLYKIDFEVLSSYCQRSCTRTTRTLQSSVSSVVWSVDFESGRAEEEYVHFLSCSKNSSFHRWVFQRLSVGLFNVFDLKVQPYASKFERSV